jgi:hypothetical protein
LFEQTFGLHRSQGGSHGHLAQGMLALQ